MRPLRALALAATIVAALALTLTAAAHAVDGTGPFTFTSTGAVDIQVNPNGPTLTCSSATYEGTAVQGQWSMPVALDFTGCGSSGVTCDAPNGTLDLAPTASWFTAAQLDVDDEACEIIPVNPIACIMRTGPFTAVGIQLLGSPGTATYPVAGNTDAIPFTASGFCSLLGIPSSGTLTLRPSGGGSAVTFAQTAGADMSW